MACKVIAVALLGLLACAALASAQDSAELMKSRKYGKDYKPEEKDYKPEEKEYEHEYKNDKPYKHERKEYEHEYKPEPEEKPEWPVHVVKAPHLLNCADMTLWIDSPQFHATAPYAIGTTAALSFNIKAHGVVVGEAVLTGVAVTVDEATKSFSLNSQMTIQATGKDMEGTTLTAQGVIAWDGAKISDKYNTLVITGGKGKAAGADGTITLSGGLDENLPRSLVIKMTVPKTKDAKEHRERN